MLACTAGVTDAKARYVFLTFGVAGIYSACPLVSIWSANSIPHPAEKVSRQKNSDSFLRKLELIETLAFDYPSSSTIQRALVVAIGE